MLKLFIEWYKKRFSDPHVVSLLIVIIVLFFIIYFFNKILLPILIAIVLSYLLDRPVNYLQGSSYISRRDCTVTIYVCRINRHYDFITFNLATKC